MKSLISKLLFSIPLIILPVHMATASTVEGLFKASIGKKQYEVGIQCKVVDKGNFLFRSDKDRSIDSNGDGIVITGHQGRFFTLKVIDKHVTYNVMPGFELSKDNLDISGSGKVFTNQGKKADIAFEVHCGQPAKTLLSSN